jgi:hypothetical protein
MSSCGNRAKVRRYRSTQHAPAGGPVTAGGTGDAAAAEETGA